MRSYENLQYAFQQLELAAAYYAAGKLDDFIRNTGSLLTGDEDFLYCDLGAAQHNGQMILSRVVPRQTLQVNAVQAPQKKAG